MVENTNTPLKPEHDTPGNGLDIIPPAELARRAASTVLAPAAGLELDTAASTEVAKNAEGAEWYIPPGSDIERPVNGVFLGTVPNPNGWGQKHIDHLETATPDGFVFGVSQNSAGFTSMFAKPLSGFKLEALHVDDATGLPTWEQADPENDNRVLVSGDWGKPVTDPDSSWEQNMREGFGNPGGQVGVIRLTGPEGDVKYIAMGADFQGREDDWHVTGSYAQVTVRNPEALEQMTDNKQRAIEAAKAAEEVAPRPRFEDDYYIDSLGNNVSPDPLAEKRAEATRQAQDLIDGLRARLPDLVASGQVIERTTQWDRKRGLRSYHFAEPRQMEDGRVATMQLEVPATDEDQIEGGWGWGLKLKMAHDDGLRISDGGYSEVDIRVVLPSQFNPERRLSVSMHSGAGGWHHNSYLDQRHFNTMRPEVIGVSEAVIDADDFFRSSGLLGANETAAV